MDFIKKLLLNNQFERYFLFFINVYIFHIYGMLTGSYGITLTQFGNVLDLNTHKLSLGLSAQAIFGCIASLLATYTLDRWNRDLQYAIDVFLLSIVIILFPFSNSFTEYLVYSSLIGFFTSVINCVNTIWVVELFRENPSFFIQVLFFFYPLGATFSRLLFSPFLDNSQLPLSNQTFTNAISTNQHVESNFLSFFTNLFNNVNKSNIWIPYLCVGIMMMLGSAMIFFIYFFDPFKNSRKLSFDNEVNNKQTVSIRLKQASIRSYKQVDLEEIRPILKSRRQQILSVAFVILVCVIVAIEVGNEINFANFLPVFLTKQPYSFDEIKASYISIILTGCITIGRFINIFLSLKIETEFMIYVNFLLMFTGNLILTFCGNSSTLIWTGIGLIGTGFSSTYPLIIAFVEKRYLITNSLSSLLEFSCLFLLCVVPVAFGHIIDNIPSYFIYINTFTNLLILTLFISLHLLGSFRKM